MKKFSTTFTKIFVPAIALAAVINIAPAYADHPDRASGPGGERSRDGGSDHRRGDHGDRGDRGDRGGHGGHGGHGSPEIKVERTLNALDTDGNEIITLDEFLVKSITKAEHQFAHIDSDDDELVSLEEFLAAGSDRRHHRPDRPEIDQEALEACLADRTGTERPEAVEGETRFDEIDSDDDGFINIDEYAAAKEAHAITRFDAIDADSDGGVIPDELLGALEQGQERREAHRDCVEEQQEMDDLVEG